jgi:hypothetical protein
LQKKESRRVLSAELQQFHAHVPRHVEWDRKPEELDVCVSCLLMKAVGGFKLLIWRGVFWSVSVDFCGFWPISSIFGTDFDPFCRFSNPETGHTSTGDGRMMYSSSQMKFQAGRLSALRCHNLPFWEHFSPSTCTLFTPILHSAELD